MEKVFRIILGLAIAGGAIWYAFSEKKPSAFSPKVVGGYEVSEQTAADPLAIPIPQITQIPPKPLPTEVQKTVQDCLAQSKRAYDQKAIHGVKSLETLRGLLTSKEAPKSRVRTREAITFQTGEQIKDGTKYRALYAPLEGSENANDVTTDGADPHTDKPAASTAADQFGWKLFVVATDGLPDPEKLPDAQPEAKTKIAELLRKSTVVEHDRDELFTWADGSTAEVKMQDQRIVELAFRFEGKLLGCATGETGSIACKCF